MNNAPHPFPRGEHEEFLELCALSTSGELTDSERHRLEGHLALCHECRAAKREFDTVVNEAIPSIAAEQFDSERTEMNDHHWPLDQAEAEFFARVAAKEEVTEVGLPRLVSGSSTVVRLRSSGAETWHNIGTFFAAAIMLTIALAITLYQAGVRHGTRMTKLAPQGNVEQGVLTQRLNDAKRASDIAQAQANAQDSLISELRRRLQLQSTELSRLKAIQRQLASDARGKDASQQDFVRERNELAAKTEAAQSQLRTLQTEFDSIQHKKFEDAEHRADLEARVNGLTRLLKDRDTTIGEQEELLAHDRDIRELIGARDLYIAEVYDVARTGQTQKPYGRVFYTKGKSLIFYAYDLDQAQVTTANIFQAWGLRGSDRQQALNLGIFYEDDASKKRWILKFDDPKMLAQIDAVFVTVEPKTGGHKPSGKPLLFAYLSGNPNHP